MSTVQGAVGGGVMVWRGHEGPTLNPLIPIEYLAMEQTIYLSSNAYFQQDNSQVQVISNMT